VLPAVRRDAKNAGSAVNGSWRDRALCAEVGTEVFFPEVGEGAALAKKVCALCEVRARCLEFALATDIPGAEHGVFGGLTPHERRALARKRCLTRPAEAASFPVATAAAAAAAAGVSPRTIYRRRAAAAAGTVAC